MHGSCSPTNAKWFAWDTVVLCSIERKHLVINGDGTLLDPISLLINLETIIPTLTPGAPIKSLGNEKECKVMVEMLRETEAIGDDNTLVVVPADMENTI